MDDAAREALLNAVQTDWRTADLSPPQRALCLFAEKLTLHPAEMLEDDIVALRDAGYDDTHIHSAIQVVSYFNYINRIADAVHVDLEPEMTPYADE